MMVRMARVGFRTIYLNSGKKKNPGRNPEHSQKKVWNLMDLWKCLMTSNGKINGIW